MLELVGPAAALAIDGLSFLLAAGLVLRAPGLRVAPVRRTRPGLREDDCARACATSRAARRCATLIFGEGLAFVFFYLVVPVTVVYATESLHAGAGGYAAILAAWGVGIAIGSAVQVRLARAASSSMIMISTGAVAVGYIATAAAPTLAVAWSRA